MCGKLREKERFWIWQVGEAWFHLQEIESKQVLVDGVGDDFRSGTAHGNKDKIVGVDG